MDFSEPKFTAVHHRNVWGEWTFIFEGAKLCALQFSDSSEKKSKNVRPSSVKACAYAGPETETVLHGRIAKAYANVDKELNLYLTGKLREFSTPIKMYGTDFQLAVWNYARSIPYGETRTYKQVANAIGHSGAERAVGNALHKNPLQVIVPCHRIISSRGKLSGYALGINIKRRLLCMEGAIQNELELE